MTREDYDQLIETYAREDGGKLGEFLEQTLKNRVFLGMGALQKNMSKELEPEMPGLRSHERCLVLGRD